MPAAIPAQLAAVLAKRGAKTIVAPAMPALTAVDVLTAFKEYTRICEAEKTRREEIRADRDVQLASIKEQGRIWRAFIERTFAERRQVFSTSFEMLFRGLDGGNDAAINAALAIITEQIKTSPMKQAAELMLAMNNPDVKHITI